MSDMTFEQAYAAMYRFLDEHYKRTESADIGSLLGSMSLLPDGEPADRAVIGDWHDAVNFALSGGKAGALILTPPK